MMYLPLSCVSSLFDNGNMFSVIFQSSCIQIRFHITIYIERCINEKTVLFISQAEKKIWGWIVSAIVITIKVRVPFVELDIAVVKFGRATDAMV